MIHLIINNIFFILFILDFTKEIDFNKDCDNYYDSLNYKCEDRVCSKKGIKNICYSSSPKSIYTFEDNNNIVDCDGIITELSGDGKLLQTPQCNNNEFNYLDVDDMYSDINTLTDDITISTGTKVIFVCPRKEYQYYYYSCLRGKYERACDYAANLCSLSLYASNNNNPFCNIITELNTYLLNQKIL